MSWRVVPGGPLVSNPGRMGKGDDSLAAYVVVDIEVTDPTGFQEYLNVAGPIVAKYGAACWRPDRRPPCLKGAGSPRESPSLNFRASSVPNSGTRLPSTRFPNSSVRGPRSATSSSLQGCDPQPGDPVFIRVRCERNTASSDPTHLARRQRSSSSHARVLDVRTGDCAYAVPRRRYRCCRQTAK